MWEGKRTHIFGNFPHAAHNLVFRYRNPRRRPGFALARLGRPLKDRSGALAASSSVPVFLHAVALARLDATCGRRRGSRGDSPALPSACCFGLPLQHPVGQLPGPRDGRERRARRSLHERRVPGALVAASLGRAGEGPSDHSPCYAGVEEGDPGVSVPGAGGDRVVSATNRWQAVTSFCSILLVGLSCGELVAATAPISCWGPKRLLELSLQCQWVSPPHLFFQWVAERPPPFTSHAELHKLSLKRAAKCLHLIL